MSKDTIYRQDAIDAVRKCSVKEVTSSYMLIDKAEAMTELMSLPSAETNIVTVTIDLDEKRLNEIVEEAERRLAAEAKEAGPKKGKWVYDEERCATGIYAICTACDEEIYQTGDLKYCPNCGARMQAED